MKTTVSDLLVEKYRPKEFKDVLLEPSVRMFFDDIFSKENPVIPNLLLRGKPGGGKTTLTRIIINKLGWETLHVNASHENTVDDIRDKVMSFTSTKSLDGNMKLVHFSEADALTSGGASGSKKSGSSAQQILKDLIEETSDRVRYIMTINEISKMDGAIKSRMHEIHIKPPCNNDYIDILKHLAKILKSENIGLASKDDIKLLVKTYYPDVRKMVAGLQEYSRNPERVFRMPSIINSPTENLAKEILNTLSTKTMTDEALMGIRENILQNETTFEGDFNLLMKTMFELVAKKSLTPTFTLDKKQSILLCIGEYMYRDVSVLDREINLFGLIIKLSKLGGLA